MINKLWQKLGSIQLTIVICLLLTADLTVGYICLDRNTILFAPLNDIGLATWIQTYGRYNLSHTLWFFVLLVLLTLLCINTFVCTTDRVAALVARRRRMDRWRLFFKLAPHIMHYAMIVILVGYLCSYLFAQVLDARTLIHGLPITLPETDARIELISFDPVYYSSNRLPSYHNRVITPWVTLRLMDGDKSRTAVLGVGQPVRFKGYGIFLKNYNPKKKSGGMDRKVRIDLSIRKDPGVPLYLAGLILFTIGLGMYLTEMVISRKAKFAVAA